MGDWFGTDGIRGIAGETITARTAFALGNSLCRFKKNAVVLIGRDTRVSSDMLMLAAAAGISAGGGTVYDGGILPTAAVSFFVRRIGADYGIVVSASHNPPEYNGLKVFDRNGMKLDEKDEGKIERHFGCYSFASALSCGKIFRLPHRGAYADYIAQCCERPLSGFKFVLDCANGAASAFAPRIFEKLGAKVYCICCKTDGRSVNDHCGALYPERVRDALLKYGADAGFSYDGDADRLIAVDERGEIVDGDKILYILAKDMKSKGRLPQNLAVGTAHTNTGVERALEREGVALVRTDIGDKYVARCMCKSGAAVGGEQSGHIILSRYASTGDGILTSVKLSELITENKLSDLADVRLLPQYNASVKVRDKVRVLGSEKVREAVERESGFVERIVVRASGTEPVVRIFAEAETMHAARSSAERVRRIIIGSEE